jgi:hypothetical protein
MKNLRYLILAAAVPLFVPPADAHEDGGEPSASVSWFSAPCTEPVLLIPVDEENLRGHIPEWFPGTDDEFMDNVVSVPGPDGPLATVVITLNRCESNEMMRSHGGKEKHVTLADDTAEVLVMVMYDGGGGGPFEFYTLASYVSDPKLAGAFRWLGLPTRYTPGMVFDLDASPSTPDPAASVPFTVEIPDEFRVDGTVVRPEEYGPGGHALQYYDGNRGFVTVDHDSPEGGTSFVVGSLSVTGPKGAWLADLLGSSDVNDIEGFYLEKLEGHVHLSVLH